MDSQIVKNAIILTEEEKMKLSEQKIRYKVIFLYKM